MELETIRSYLLRKQGAFEDFPFGPEVMVYKVMEKMFTLVFWGGLSLRINLNATLILPCTFVPCTKL